MRVKLILLVASLCFAFGTLIAQSAELILYPWHEPIAATGRGLREVMQEKTRDPAPGRDADSRAGGHPRSPTEVPDGQAHPKSDRVAEEGGEIT